MYLCRRRRRNDASERPIRVITRFRTRSDAEVRAHPAKDAPWNRGQRGTSFRARIASRSSAHTAQDARIERVARRSTAASCARATMTAASVTRAEDRHGRMLRSRATKGRSLEVWRLARWQHPGQRSGSTAYGSRRPPQDRASFLRCRRSGSNRHVFLGQRILRSHSTRANSHVTAKHPTNSNVTTHEPDAKAHERAPSGQVLGQVWDRLRRSSDAAQGSPGRAARESRASAPQLGDPACGSD